MKLLEYKLCTQEQLQQLIENGKPENLDQDHMPVVKWFVPNSYACWLVSEIVDDETAFGLCDLGHGFPELGYISLNDITEYVCPFGNKIIRDTMFRGHFQMSVYREAAQSIRMITDDIGMLTLAHNKLNEDQIHP